MEQQPEHYQYDLPIGQGRRTKRRMFDAGIVPQHDSYNSAAGQWTVIIQADDLEAMQALLDGPPKRSRGRRSRRSRMGLPDIAIAGINAVGIAVVVGGAMYGITVGPLSIGTGFAINHVGQGGGDAIASVGDGTGDAIASFEHVSEGTGSAIADMGEGMANVPYGVGEAIESIEEISEGMGEAIESTEHINEGIGSAIAGGLPDFPDISLFPSRSKQQAADPAPAPATPEPKKGLARLLPDLPTLPWRK